MPGSEERRRGAVEVESTSEVTCGEPESLLRRDRRGESGGPIHLRRLQTLLVLVCLVLGCGPGLVQIDTAGESLVDADEACSRTPFSTASVGDFPQVPDTHFWHRLRDDVSTCWNAPVFLAVRGNDESTSRLILFAREYLVRFGDQGSASRVLARVLISLKENEGLRDGRSPETTRLLKAATQPGWWLSDIDSPSAAHHGRATTGARYALTLLVEGGFDGVPALIEASAEREKRLPRPMLEPLYFERLLEVWKSNHVTRRSN